MSTQENNTIKSRSALYYIVWHQPIYEIIHQWTVSYFSIIQYCDLYELPKPTRHGRDYQPIALPHLSDTENLPEIYLRKRKNTSFIDTLYKNLLSWKSKIISPSVDRYLKGNPKLSEINQQILKASKHYLKHGDNRTRPKLFNSIERLKTGFISIGVSPALNQHALIFLESFLKILEFRGYNLTFNFYESYISIGESEHQVYLHEKGKRVKIETPNGYSDSYIKPTGLLLITTGQYSSKKVWSETKNISLLDKIPTIIAYLELEAEKHRLEKINSKQREKLARLKQDILEKRRGKRQEQITQLRELIIDFHHWKKIRIFDEYLKSWPEDQKEKNKDLYELGQSLSNWIDPSTKKPIPGLTNNELREIKDLFLKY